MAKDKSGNGDAKNTAGETSDNNAEQKTKVGDANETEKKDAEKPALTFQTQEDFDAVIEKRLERDRKKREDDAKLSDTQRLEKQRDAATAKAAESDRRHNFIVGTKIADYSKASRLYNAFKDEIEFDDNNKPSNLDAVLKTAREETPEFFPKKLEGGGGGGEGAGDDDKPGGVSMNTLLRNASGRK